MKYNKFIQTLSLVTAVIVNIGWILNSHACDRVLHVSKLDDKTCSLVYPASGLQQCKIVVTGQNMDWTGSSSMDSQLWFFPSGMVRQGLPDSDNPMKWTSIYSSIIISGFNDSTTVGLNNQGFAVNSLIDHDADYGKPDTTIPGLSWTIYVQYLLDKFATVNTAVASLKSSPLQIRGGGSVPSATEQPLFHYAISDASGDSAILEYIKPGILTIYHNNKDATYPVLTNQPNFQKQLAILEYWESVDKPSVVALDIGTELNQLTEKMPEKLTGAAVGPSFLPGTPRPTDRFVRASLYQQQMPNAQTNKVAVVNILSVLRSLITPFTTWTEYPKTIWQTVANNTDLKFYYADTRELDIIFVDLKAEIFQDGKVMLLDRSKHPVLSGNASDLFEPHAPFVFEGTQ